MNTEVIAAIEAAQSSRGLDCAMDDYLQQLGVDCPEVLADYALHTALRRHQYFLAISLIPRSELTRRQLHVVTEVLKQAADKQFSFSRGR